ncbi:hypothetical protein EVAR_68079_1 [Eumeta japonica]|uniref:Uncharacterized protein n=1 Tax=Eumeta variegata TaxID=151549 RepID=A0A4C1ZN95_EUMVA|nr:hypothetical protein EVAR_68079_1 [Eumeta japonica]
MRTRYGAPLEERSNIVIFIELAKVVSVELTGGAGGAGGALIDGAAYPARECAGRAGRFVKFRIMILLRPHLTLLASPAPE